MKKTAVEPPKVSTDNSLKKKKLKIATILSRKIYKGEPHYMVTYIDMPESVSELISRDCVRKRDGEHLMAYFDKKYEKKLRVEFSFGSLFNSDTGTVEKKKLSDKNIKSSDKEEKRKSSKKKDKHKKKKDQQDNKPTEHKKKKEQQEQEQTEKKKKKEQEQEQSHKKKKTR